MLRPRWYPALDDDEDDKPLVGPDRTTVSDEEGGDHKPLVRPGLPRKSPEV